MRAINAINKLVHLQMCHAFKNAGPSWLNGESALSPRHSPPLYMQFLAGANKRDHAKWIQLFNSYYPGLTV